MSKYRLVASDLDGTLLNSKVKLSPENHSAITQMAERGVYFVPSSGRTLEEIPAEIRDHAQIRYIIHSDGAVVYDKLTGDRIDLTMSHEVSMKLLEILWEYDTDLSVRYEGRSYVDDDTNHDDFHRYHRMSDAYRIFVYQTNHSVKQFRSFCRSMDRIEMICAFFHRDDEMAECRQRLLQMDEYMVAASEPYNLEVYSRDAGKGKALLRLAEQLGLDRSQTIAVGDSPNDRNMLECAGLGLAMENADDAIKELSDEVACHHDQHIAKYLLEKYL